MVELSTTRFTEQEWWRQAADFKMQFSSGSLRHHLSTSKVPACFVAISKVQEGFILSWVHVKSVIFFSFL